MSEKDPRPKRETNPRLRPSGLTPYRRSVVKERAQLLYKDEGSVMSERGLNYSYLMPPFSNADDVAT